MSCCRAPGEAYAAQELTRVARQGWWVNTCTAAAGSTALEVLVLHQAQFSHPKAVLQLRVRHFAKLWVLECRWVPKAVPAVIRKR